MPHALLAALLAMGARAVAAGCGERHNNRGLAMQGMPVDAAGPCDCEKTCIQAGAAGWTFVNSSTAPPWQCYCRATWGETVNNCDCWSGKVAPPAPATTPVPNPSLTPAPTTPSGWLLHRRSLKPSVACLDGSPAGYYVRPSEDGGFYGRWVLFLEGGGECAGPADCAERRASRGFHFNHYHGGSSAPWKESIDPAALASMDSPDAAAVVSSDPAVNPYFARWGKVYVPYCSGDDWLGDERGPTNPWTNASGALNFTFSGHRILESVVDALVARYGVDEADDVVFTGGSAGGQGVFYHADWLDSRLPGVRVHANPQSAWFGLQYPSYQQWLLGDARPVAHPTLPPWLARIRAWAHPGCAAAMRRQGRSPLDCGDAPTLFPHLRARVFVSQNLYDTWTISIQGGAPWNVPAGSPIAVEASGYAVLFGNVMRASLRGAMAAQNGTGNGLFAPACLEHAVRWWPGPTIGNVTHSQAVAQWVAGHAPPVADGIDPVFNHVDYSCRRVW